MKNRFTRSDIRNFLFESKNSQMINEISILGYEVDINKGNIEIDGKSYSVSVAGISDAFDKSKAWGDGIIKAGITALIGTTVSITSVDDGMIIGSAGGQESKLKIEDGSKTYNDLQKGLKADSKEFMVDGPRVKLKFSRV